MGELGIREKKYINECKIPTLRMLQKKGTGAPTVSGPRQPGNFMGKDH